MPQPVRRATSRSLPNALPELQYTPGRSRASLPEAHPPSLPPPATPGTAAWGWHPRPVSPPQGRPPHQRFPAAGAPIGGRPAAPNINDTQEPGLEAQARELPPIGATPATGAERFSILSGASGNPMEAETGSREQPLVLSPPSPRCLPHLEPPAFTHRGNERTILSYSKYTVFFSNILETNRVEENGVNQSWTPRDLPDGLTRLPWRPVATSVGKPTPEAMASLARLQARSALLGHQYYFRNR